MAHRLLLLLLLLLLLSHAPRGARRAGQWAMRWGHAMGPPVFRGGVYRMCAWGMCIPTYLPIQYLYTGNGPPCRPPTSPVSPDVCMGHVHTYLDVPTDTVSVYSRPTQ